MPVKNISAIIYFLIMLVSCQTSDKTTDPPGNLAEKFKPFLNGYWVTSDYIDDLAKTRSPVKSSEKLTYITEFSIDSTGLSGDSTHIGAAFGNHEGGDFILYFRQGHLATSLVTGITDYDTESNSYELGYVVNSHDTSLVLYHYDKNKKLLDKTKYTKAPANKSGDGTLDGFQYLVNKRLISGSYKIFDSSGQEMTSKLTSDGKITGFKEFRTYYIITDFASEPENTTDQICFEIQTKDQKCYGFEFRRDTLNLFEIPKDEMDTLFKPGPPVYKFVKQN